MYAELYQYLLQYKKLAVPGVGTFLLERNPASIDFLNKQALPPRYSFKLDAAAKNPSKSFFNWLGAALHVTDLDAIIQFNNFVFDIKKQLAEGAVIKWKGVGEIKKGLDGGIRFNTAEPHFSEQQVPAIKVLRHKVEHTVRVGEDHKTSVEMIEMLSHTEEKRSYWWAWGLVLGLLAVLFLGWYFSENGVDPDATANKKKLVLPASTATYRQVP